VYRRLIRTDRPPVWLFDPGAQVQGGKRYESAAQLAADLSRGVCPQLAVVCGGEVEELAALALRVRYLTLWIDEMDRACNDKKWLAPSVKTIVHEGRHKHIDLFGSFRFTRNVSEDLIGSSDAVFLFHTSTAAVYDLQTIRQRFGPHYADAVVSLERHRFVIWTDDM